MKPYDSHPDVPVWLAALNGQLLTTTELDILNFIFWCTKHGCRTSNDRIGMFTHHSHATVQRAVMKLYSMDLVAIENFSKRTRCLKAVRWPDQEAWLKYKKLQGKIESDAAHHAPHIPPLDKTHPLRGESRGGSSEPTFQVGSFSPGGGRPQPPAAVQWGEKPTYQEGAAEMYNKLISVGWNPEQAKHKTRKRYPTAKFDED